MSRAVIAAALIAALVVGGSIPAVSAAPAPPDPLSDPFALGWPTYNPTVLADRAASTETGCVRGTVACVDNVVAAMQARLGPLGCAHDAVFALVYLRTTEEYRRAVSDPTFFADNAYVNHEDALFADTYLQAFDRFHAGNLAEVPPAWRIAFHAAGGKEVTSLGNMLLGMSAHINRDLPFVLNAIGLVSPQGVSRKADHDRVNAILAVVNRYALYEVSLRYDPTAGDGHAANTTMDSKSLQNLVTRWREQAWANAELLARARTPAQRLQVATAIETQAAATARSLRTSYRHGPGDDVAARDAFCAAHLAS
jgi:hypothetical protein